MTLPAGVFSETYDQDQALIRTRKQWIWFFALITLMLLFPFIMGGGILGTMNVIGVTVIAVVGLQITTGYAGQINIGQSAFMGVGAYICGTLSVNFGLPFWITIPIGGVGAAIFGAIFGLAAVRIRGFYMALTTLAAQYVFHFTMLKLPKEWFGQSGGLRLDPASVVGFSFDSDIRMYYLIFFIAALMLYGAWSLVRSNTGRSLVAVRDNDNAAEIIGISNFYYKSLAFFIGAFYAGIAGGLWAYYVRYVQVDQFTLCVVVK